MSRISRAVAVALCAALLFAGCGGRPPTRPSESLSPSVAGIVTHARVEPPFALLSGVTYAPPPGQTVRVILPNASGRGASVGALLLGGQAPDGSWWYTTANEEPNDDGSQCFSIPGGGFDEGDAVLLANGILLPKAIGFRILVGDHLETPGENRFTPNVDDRVCVDATGHATLVIELGYL